MGPYIKVTESKEFPKKLKIREKQAWKSFVVVAEGFLGNHKRVNYIQLVETLANNYVKMVFGMSVLDSHLKKFKEEMGACSGEQEERFH